MPIFDQQHRWGVGKTLPGKMQQDPLSVFRTYLPAQALGHLVLWHIKPDYWAQQRDKRLQVRRINKGLRHFGNAFGICVSGFDPTPVPRDIAKGKVCGFGFKRVGRPSNRQQAFLLNDRMGLLQQR